MKKVLFVIVLLIAAVVVNAQTTGTSTTKAKTTTTTVTNQEAVRTNVLAGELPKPITEYLAKDYAGYTCKEATSVSLNNKVTYEAVIVKGTTTETLVFDKEGKFLKKLAPKVVK
jgi:archaellum component FlaG (FlaF/FlaG flagellin family)